MGVVKPEAEEKQPTTELRKVRWTKRRTGDDTLRLLEPNRCYSLLLFAPQTLAQNPILHSK
jgi:hypothetical protein